MLVVDVAEQKKKGDISPPFVLCVIEKKQNKRERKDRAIAPRIDLCLTFALQSRAEARAFAEDGFPRGNLPSLPLPLSLLQPDSNRQESYKWVIRLPARRHCAQSTVDLISRCNYLKRACDQLYYSSMTNELNELKSMSNLRRIIIEIYIDYIDV